MLQRDHKADGANVHVVIMRNVPVGWTLEKVVTLLHLLELCTPSEVARIDMLKGDIRIHLKTETAAQACLRLGGIPVPNRELEGLKFMVELEGPGNAQGAEEEVAEGTGGPLDEVALLKCLLQEDASTAGPMTEPSVTEPSVTEPSATCESRESRSGEEDDDSAADDSQGLKEVTTVVIAQLPRGCRHIDVINMLIHYNLAGTFDFVYLPQDFVTKRTKRYAFVNFRTAEDAKACQLHLTEVAVGENEVLEVWPARVQGFAANVRAFLKRRRHKHIRQQHCQPMVYAMGSCQGRCLLDHLHIANSGVSAPEAPDAARAECGTADAPYRKPVDVPPLPTPLPVGAATRAERSSPLHIKQSDAAGFHAVLVRNVPSSWDKDKLLSLINLVDLCPRGDVLGIQHSGRDFRLQLKTADAAQGCLQLAAFPVKHQWGVWNFTVELEAPQEPLGPGYEARPTLVSAPTVDPLEPLQSRAAKWADMESNACGESPLNDLAILNALLGEELEMETALAGRNGLVTEGHTAADGNEVQQEVTTLVINRLPRAYKQADVVDMLDFYGFAGTFDFLYLPQDFVTRQSKGYAFVNFRDARDAQRCRSKFEQVLLPNHPERLSLVPARVQGYEENVNAFLKRRRQKHIRQHHCLPMVFSEAAPRGTPIMETFHFNREHCGLTDL